MKKAIDALNKINFLKILMIYILTQPIIDMATSLCVRYINPSFTVGIIIRSLFLLFLLLYAFFIANKKWKKIMLCYCLALFIYIVMFYINTSANMTLSTIISQFKSIIKIFYFPILLIVFVPIIKNMDSKYLKYTLFGYTAIMFITTVSGIAFDSYANGSGEGKNGLFYAANEIGIILSILMPFLLLSITNYKEKTNTNKIFDFICIIFVIFSALWMGTKVPFLGLILSLLLTMIICIIYIIRKKYIRFHLHRMIGTILILIIIFSFVGKTPVGKNLGISLKSIAKSFEVKYGQEITNDVLQSKDDKTTNSNTQLKENKITNSSTQPKEDKTTNSNSKPKENKVNSNLETIVLSSRNIYYKNTLSDYRESSIMSKILGIGFIDSENGKSFERKYIEIDYFDILFSTGILGAILCFTPLIIALLYIVKLLWIKKVLIFRKDVLFYGYAIGIALIIARMAGHVFTAPAVSFYLALIINQLISILKDESKNEII